MRIRRMGQGGVLSRALVACGVVAVMGAAAAHGDEAESQTTAAAKSAYSNKLICKREHVTGSMIPKQVCKTQEQMDKEQKQLKQYADEMNRSSTATPPSAPGPLPGDAPRG